MTSLRVMRERQIAASALLDNYNSREESSGNVSQSARTTTVTSYPVAAGSYFAMNPTTISGTESEGSSATITPDTNTVIYAYNLGSGIPPNGTDTVIHLAGNRWTFRWDS